MQTYVIVTGIVWVLILVAHVARLFAEGPHLFKEPSFLVSSLLCLGLTVWAGRILVRLRGNRAGGPAGTDLTGARK